MLVPALTFVSLYSSCHTKNFYSFLCCTCTQCCGSTRMGALGGVENTTFTAERSVKNNNAARNMFVALLMALVAA